MKQFRKLDGNTNQAQKHADKIANSRPFYMQDIPKDQQVIIMAKDTDLSRLNLKACFEISEVEISESYNMTPKDFKTFQRLQKAL